MENLTVKAHGLFTFPNQLSECPPGSLAQADNVIIDREGVLELRRGYNTLPGAFGTNTSYRANQIFKFDGNVLTHYGPLNVPDKMAFYSPTVVISGRQTSGSNVINDLVSVQGLYVGQYITPETIEQFFTGDLLLGSNTILNVPSTTGLYVGQRIGTIGIPANTTISSITGTGPFTVTMSAVSTYTKTNSAVIASNVNILGFPANTQITAIGTTSITVSNNATVSSRSFTFLPAAVDTTGDLINSAINGLVNGQTVEFTSTGTLPAGLTSGVPYYVINADDTLFQVSLISDGTAVDITTQGTGVHTLIVRNIIDSYGWIDYSGTFLKPDTDVKVRSVEANNNVYFTTSAGIKKLDSLTSAITNSGAPKGLDGFAVLDNSTSGFMPNDVQVAYRVVWGYKDLNKNVILGAPSQRIVIANSSGTTKDVDLNITIPADVTTSYFYQVYRSGFSATANDEPNDEMSLVYEANPTALDLSNGYVTVVDQTPESLRNGASLYTSPSQEGILQANEPPPFAKDVTLFKGSTFYANTKTKQNLTLSILAVSGQFSFQANITNVLADTPTTIRSISYSVTGDLVSGSSTINNVSDVSSLYVGQKISDTTNPTYIPADTVITEILNSNTITISAAATGTSVGDTLDIEVIGLLIGQKITGTGIPAGTTILQVYDEFSTTGDVTNTSTSITNIPSTVLFKVGQIITGTGIPVDTSVVSIDSATSITISKPATATTAATALTLARGIQISQSPTATTVGVTLTVQNGTGGIQLNDTLTIAGTTYTAKSVENISAKQFKLYAQGSPAQNISDTAQSLIRVVNRTTSPSPTVYAYYLSGFQELPGKIFFQERIFGGGIFYATAGTALQGAAYSPNLPAAGGTSVSSQNDEFANGLYYSKTQQPEAVPLLNFTKVGSAHAAILRVIALRDSLFILKEDGVFRLTGESPTSFRVDLFDGTTQILSAESAVSLNNLIFMLSKYGIVTISDSSVEVISRPIEDKMLDLFELGVDKVSLLSFGISYESDRKYIFFCVNNSSDVVATQAYVYNTFTKTWTRWVLTQGCGIVQPSEDVLYLGDSTSNTFDIERKTRTYTDYTDRSFTTTLSAQTGVTSSGSPVITGIADTTFFYVGQSISGTGIPDSSQIIAIETSEITINKDCTSSGTTTLLQDAGKTVILSSLEDIQTGDVLWQANGRYSIITALNDINSTVTTRDFINDWVLGETTILKAAESIVKYVPQTSENPGQIKQYREATLLMQVAFFNQVSIGFDTDISPGVENVSLNGQYGTQWGRFPWGTIPWGGDFKAAPIRTYVPQQKQRCSLMNVTLTHREAYSFYRLNGISYIHNNLSERVNR